jgi:hypothetical protein
MVYHDGRLGTCRGARRGNTKGTHTDRSGALFRAVRVSYILARDASSLCMEARMGDVGSGTGGDAAKELWADCIGESSTIARSRLCFVSWCLIFLSVGRHGRL